MWNLITSTAEPYEKFVTTLHNRRALHLKCVSDMSCFKSHSRQVTQTLSHHYITSKSLRCWFTLSCVDRHGSVTILLAGSEVYKWWADFNSPCRPSPLFTKAYIFHKKASQVQQFCEKGLDKMCFWPDDMKSRPWCNCMCVRACLCISRNTGQMLLKLRSGFWNYSDSRQLPHLYDLNKHKKAIQ